MGNPMFRGLPVPKIFNVLNSFNRLQNDPSQIVPFLKQSGRLTDEQLSAIENMQSPEEIGRYLMGSAPQNLMGSVQSNVMNIRNQMKKGV